MSDYWVQYEGKTIPLKDLLQWLSDEHEHVTDDEDELLDGWDYPVVNSMALHRWAIAEALADEYEYNIQATDLDDGEKWLYRETWEPDTGWLERKLEELNEYAEEMEHTYTLVKRRRAGRIEDV